jgi:hypothetical protein
MPQRGTGWLWRGTGTRAGALRAPPFYNEHVGALLADVPERELILRLVEREANDWSRRLSPAQRAWVAARRQRRYRGTLAAAEAIVAALADVADVARGDDRPSMYISDKLDEGARLRSSSRSGPTYPFRHRL